MSMLRQAPPRAGADVKLLGSLLSFMAEWTTPLLAEAERNELLAIFSLLTSLAFAPTGVNRRAALCSDGTPLEISLALDDRGRHAIRFVCDVASGLTPQLGVNQSFRELADAVVPRFKGRVEALDSLFDRHLSGAYASSRFHVWYGAGFAPGIPRMGKLYFNTEWLSAAEIYSVLASHIGFQEVRVLDRLPVIASSQHAGVGYDFDASGLRKAKLYVRTPIFDPEDVLGITQRFCGARLDCFRRLLDQSIGSLGVGSRTGTSILSIGFLSPSTKHEVKIYLHLDSWGLPDFQSVAPTLKRLLEGWGFDATALERSPGPRGCAPTLLALGVDDDREMLSLYFKPLLQQTLDAALVGASDSRGQR